MSYNKETELYDGYIYCITNKLNCKQYVGQTLRSVDIRFNCHLSEAKNNYDIYPLHRAMRKYGRNGFNVDTIKTVSCTSKKELQKKLNYFEKFYIKEFNTYNPNGYNLTIGGDTSGYCRGKEVVKVDRFGNILETFESGADACRKNGISDTSLSSVLTSRTDKAYGYYWYYKNDIRIKDNKIIDWECKDKYVAKYSISGILLNIYSSLFDASENTKIKSSRISECCSGKRPIANGFQFKYFDTFESVPNKIKKYNSVRCQNKVVAQYSCFGDLLDIFDNRKIASKKLGISYVNIDKSCRNRTATTSNNYQFRYYDNYDVVDTKIDKCLKYSCWGKVVAQYTFKGELVQTFNSVITASENLGISKVSIEDCCNGKKPSVIGYQFRFYDSLNDVLHTIAKINHKKKLVWQKALSGEKIMLFDSAAEAERKVNIDHSMIAACCKNKIKSAGGYIWEYAEEGAA